MPIIAKRRSATSKYRGKRTMGRGKKAGRGKGKRGGHGNAGLHKHKYLHTVKYDPMHFGRHGFKVPSAAARPVVAINVQQLEERWGTVVPAGAAGGGDVADLSVAGIDKLLGGGRVTRPLKVRVKWASPQAVSKVQAAGGSVEQTAKRAQALRAERQKARKAAGKAKGGK
ncbi:MAG TPA: uL15m family ribosomal protein [Candidatus Thermoplasmatota archaeon]